MASVLGELLGTGVAAALSPLAVVAVVLLLASKAPVRNGTAFFFGWTVTSMVMVMVVIATGIGISPEKSDRGGGWVTLALGVFMLAFAAVTWRGRPRPGAEPRTPAWMTSLKDASIAGSFGLGVVLQLTNVKNLPINAASALMIVGANLQTANQWIAVGFYAVIGALGVLIPLLFFVTARERSEKALNSLRVWLIRHNATIMTLMFLVMGVQTVGKGISALG
jgi:hypothetical protein